MSIFDDYDPDEQPPPLPERFRDMPTVKPDWAPWPADKPFPWTDAECAAFVRGYPVHWPLSLDDFWELPGKIELIDGYARLWRA